MQLREAMLSRTRDKMTNVRVQSVLALKRLQPQDPEEVAESGDMSELVRLMTSDPAKYVQHPLFRSRQRHC